MPETTTPSTLAERFAKALEIIATDLLLISESDDTYKAFSAPMPKTTELTPENFLAVAGLRPTYKKVFEPYGGAKMFFRDCRDREEPNSEEIAAYRLLEKVMNAGLSEQTVYYVSSDDMEEKPEVHFFVFGRMKDGNLAGLRAISIQT